MMVHISLINIKVHPKKCKKITARNVISLFQLCVSTNNAFLFCSTAPAYMHRNRNDG